MNTRFLKSMNLFLLSAICLSLFLVSCGEKPAAPKDEEITTDSASLDAKLILDQIFVNIPAPMDLTKELSKSGFNYNKAILSSSSKAGSFSTSYKSAANLGVCGADLSYASSYGQVQDALGYLNVIKQLSEKVGVGNAFDATMIQRFEGNVNNKDTMESIIKGAYDKASRNLRSNERVSTASIIAAGGWVEALYISTQVLNGAEKNAKSEAAFQRVWNQLYAFQYIQELLMMYEKNPDCAQMIKDIESMKELADRYGKTVSLSTEDVKIVGDAIAIVRNSITN